MGEYMSLDSLYSENLLRLYRIVKDIESADNPYAVRFERHYVDRIKDTDKAFIRAKKHIYAYATSIKAYLSFSVGRLQFMVYNLYFIDALYEYLQANNLLPVSIPYVIDEKHEIALFDLFLKERLTGFYAKLRANAVNINDFKTFGRLWNGTEAYGEKVFKRYEGSGLHRASQ